MLRHLLQNPKDQGPTVFGWMWQRRYFDIEDSRYLSQPSFIDLVGDPVLGAQMS